MNLTDGTSYLVSKLTAFPAVADATRKALIEAYPPVAISHYGVGFIKTALEGGGRLVQHQYIESICSDHDG